MLHISEILPAPIVYKFFVSGSFFFGWSVLRFSFSFCFYFQSFIGLIRAVRVTKTKLSCRISGQVCT